MGCSEPSWCIFQGTGGPLGSLIASYDYLMVDLRCIRKIIDLLEPYFGSFYIYLIFPSWLFHRSWLFRDPRSDLWPLMSSIWPTTFICIAYIYVVKVPAEIREFIQLSRLPGPTS